MDLNINKPVPGAKEFYPLNEPPIGTTLSPVRICQDFQSEGVVGPWKGFIALTETIIHPTGDLSKEQKSTTAVQALDNSGDDIPESYLRCECTQLTGDWPRNQAIMTNTTPTLPFSRRCANSVRTMGTRRTGTSCTSGCVLLYPFRKTMHH
jgi:hypothetical protein